MAVMPTAGALQILVPGFWQEQQDELLINAVVTWLGDHLLEEVFEILGRFTGIAGMCVFRFLESRDPSQGTKAPRLMLVYLRVSSRITDSPVQRSRSGGSDFLMELGGGGNRNVSKAEDQDGAQAEAGSGRSGARLAGGFGPRPQPLRAWFLPRPWHTEPRRTTSPISYLIRKAKVSVFF